jgi:hypothetical protein
MSRNTPKDEKIKELVDHILGTYLAIHFAAQAFPGKLIDDVQYPKSPAISCPFYHEIITPDMVLMFRT